MPGKPALVAEGVGYVLDSNVSRVWMERPEADAGKSGDGVVGSHTPRKSRRIHSAQFPTRWCSSREAVKPPLPRTTKGRCLRRGGQPGRAAIRSLSPAPRSPQWLFWSSPSSTAPPPPAGPVPAFGVPAATARLPSFQQAPPSKERSPSAPACSPPAKPQAPNALAFRLDRKSTRLNSSHANISYAVFCLKKKK